FFPDSIEALTKKDKNNPNQPIILVNGSKLLAIAACIYVYPSAKTYQQDSAYRGHMRFVGESACLLNYQFRESAYLVYGDTDAKVSNVSCLFLKFLPDCLRGT
nr:hypothetical protein [Tanacetum cinerariifolium]